ncbi:MAG TPA: hypothetical protein VHB97_04735, partial [Polyangia bacterium]|nr:hypothetical protein [Polyangia bacterium]
MRWLAAVGCALWAATTPNGRCCAAEHVFIADGTPARMHCGAAPPGWQQPELDDRDWNTRVTIVERRDSGAPVEADVPRPVALDAGATDRSATDRSAADRSATDRSAADRSATDHSATDRNAP